LSQTHRLLRLGASAAATILVTGAAVATTAPQALAAISTTAWQSGRFVVDIPNLVRRSDLVLGRPNTDPTQFMVLGNGTLGVAAWAGSASSRRTRSCRSITRSTCAGRAGRATRRSSRRTAIGSGRS
jgi:hypothetical protein